MMKTMLESSAAALVAGNAPAVFVFSDVVHAWKADASM